MSQHTGETRHDPTQARLRRARAQGQIGTSSELVSAMVWLGGIAVLATLGTTAWRVMGDSALAAWSSVDVSASPESSLRDQLAGPATLLGTALLPGMIILLGVSVLAHQVQTGFRLYPQRLVPDWRHVSAVQGIRRLFSLDNVVRTLLGGCKLLSLIGLAAMILWQDLPELLSLGQLPAPILGQRAAEYLIAILLKLTLVAVLVGFADYGLKCWLMRRRLRMSEQETREEERSAQPAQHVSQRRRLIRERPHASQR